MNITSLSLDLETKSSIDIGKAGAYRYTESPDFDILLFGVSVNSGPVTVYDLPAARPYRRRSLRHSQMTM